MAPPSGKIPIVSKEKVLYTKLLNITQSPADSMQVVAFLMWLQTLIMTDVENLLIGKMMKHPIKVMDAIAGEIMECLKCVQSEIMPFTDGVYDASLLRAFVFDATELDLTLEHLYRNRRIVINGVRKMVRSFNGIYDGDNESSTASSSAASPRTPATSGSKFFCGDAGNRGSQASRDKAVVKSNDVGENSVILTTPPKEDAAVMKRYVLYGRYRRDEEDGRTIFLTFSRGYPLPAHEIASFFNKWSVMDKIYMKNVEENEQVLYARMVCSEPAAADAIAGHYGGLIAKYIIRGRHVWARKYVKRY